MTGHDSKGPMTFHDVAAYFSEEEWKLLHEWQKEIYRNVMKDIQQVLLSLGPLIATSVFSLRIKEKDTLYPEDHDDFQGKPGMDRLPSDTIVPSNMIFGINRDEDEYVEDPPDKNGSQSHAPSHTAGLPTPITDGDLKRNATSGALLTAHRGSKAKESSPSSSAGHEASTQMIMMSIKEEEETYPLAHQDYEGSAYPLAHPESERSDYPLALLDYDTSEGRRYPTVTKISENQKPTTHQSEYEDTFRVLHLEQPVPHPSEEQLTHNLEYQRFPYVIQTASESCTNSNEQVRYNQHPIYEYYEKCTAIRNPFGSDSIEFKCKCCSEDMKKTIIKVKGSTTSNLLRHIERHHHSKYVLFQKAHKAYQEAKLKQNVTHPKPKCMLEVNKKKQKIFEKKDLDESLALMIAQDCQPLSTVENSGFLSFVSKLNCRYEIPSRKCLTYNILPKMHKDVKHEVVFELENATHIALTFDMWTSQDNDAYFALTGHFLQQRASVMKHFCLGVKSLHGTGTAENLVEQILFILKEHSLPLERISSLTTDNGCNIVKAVNLLGLSERHIRCMGNCFHLIVTKAIKNVASLSIIFDKCRSISKFFRNCPASSCLLKDIQIGKKLPQIKLKLDVVSRWNSIYDMVKSVLQQDIAINAALSAAAQANKTSPQNIPQALTAHEAKILKDVVEILHPFVIATEKLSRQSFATSSMMIPIVSEVQASLCVLTEQHTVVEGAVLESSRDNDDPCQEESRHSSTISLFCKTMKDLTHATFENIENHSILGKATLLDPRFKTYGFQEKDVADFLVKELELEIQELMNKALSVTQAAECGSPPPKKKPSLDFWQTLSIKKAESEKSKISAISEVGMYIAEDIEDCSTDVFLWWGWNSQRYPILSQLAFKYLCGTATSVPSEQLFSKTGDIVCIKRACLSPSHLEMLTLIKANYSQCHLKAACQV